MRKKKKKMKKMTKSDFSAHKTTHECTEFAGAEKRTAENHSICMVGLGCVASMAIIRV